jgi:CBS domain-containing protein
MSDTAILTLRTMLANLDDAKKYQSLRDVMSTLPAPDLAAVFEDLPPEKLPVLFRLCPKDLAAEIFAELTPETQQGLIDGLTDKELKAVVDDLFVDDATDLVEEMPANVVKRILAQADPATRRMINELLKYPEDSAGGVMTTELMELRPDWTVSQAMAAIRKNGFDKETINNCYVTDRDRTLIGVVSLRALVLSKDPDNELIRDMMDDNVVSVSTTTDQEDVSQMFEKYGYLAIPVVDNEKRLVGIVTIDDAISIMQDEASEDIAKPLIGQRGVVVPLGRAVGSGDAVAVVGTQVCHAGADELHDLVLHIAVGVGRGNQRQRDIVRADARSGLAGQVDGNDPGIAHIVGAAHELLGQLAAAFADGHRAEGAVAGVGVRAQDHPPAAGHHLAVVAVDDGHVRRNIDAAVFVGGGQGKLVVVLVDGAADSAEAVVAVRHDVGQRELRHAGRAGRLDDADIGDVVAGHRVELQLQLVRITALVVGLQDTVGHSAFLSFLCVHGAAGLLGHFLRAGADGLAVYEVDTVIV